MYILAILLIPIIFLPFIVQIEGVDDNTQTLWVVVTAVLSGLSFGLGYSQRPKTEAQACK
jgi:RsiW-degrading membrane proteinase PrsW (M82 family)